MQVLPSNRILLVYQIIFLLVTAKNNDGNKISDPRSFIIIAKRDAESIVYGQSHIIIVQITSDNYGLNHIIVTPR
jgi:hypothetical protein